MELSLPKLFKGLYITIIMNYTHCKPICTFLIPKNWISVVLRDLFELSSPGPSPSPSPKFGPRADNKITRVQ